MMEFFFLKNSAQYGQSFLSFYLSSSSFLFTKSGVVFFPIKKISQKLWILAEKNTVFQWKHKFCKFF
jgi:hypothetical protein